MLIDTLEANGKLKVPDLRALYRSNCKDTRIGIIIAEAVASGDPILEQNGGVLLKEHLESGGDFTDEEWEIIISSLSQEMHWTCRLNLCHALVVNPDPMERDPIAFSAFLHEAINDKNAFLRSWAISAFWALADFDPNYVDEALGYRKQALKEKSASILARMRNLRVDGNRLTDAQFPRRK